LNTARIDKGRVERILKIRDIIKEKASRKYLIIKIKKIILNTLTLFNITR